MKLHIHLSSHLCPKSQSFPFILGVKHPSISHPTWPLLCPHSHSHSRTLPHKFSYLRLPSHQPTCEQLKLPSLFSTSFTYFFPVFPPTLITSFLSLHFPSLLLLFPLALAVCHCYFFSLLLAVLSAWALLPMAFADSQIPLFA